jgi:hypothetical protein
MVYSEPLFGSFFICVFRKKFTTVHAFKET